MQRVLVSIAVVLVLAAGIGCSSKNIPGLYQIDVRQGNYIDQQLVNQLHPGMSKRQVQYLLGTPLINDPFHQDRWDYVYSFRPGGGDVEQRHVTLHFRGDVLDRIDRQLGDTASEPPG